MFFASTVVPTSREIYPVTTQIEKEFFKKNKILKKVKNRLDKRFYNQTVKKMSFEELKSYTEDKDQLDLKYSDTKFFNQNINKMSTIELKSFSEKLSDKVRELKMKVQIKIII